MAAPTSSAKKIKKLLPTGSHPHMGTSSRWIASSNSSNVFRTSTGEVLELLEI
jgi:hypothetical protein